MTSKLLLFYHTVRHLRARQIVYQLFYRLKRAFFDRQIDYRKYQQAKSCQLHLVDSIPSQKSYFGNGKFVFLNQEVVFEGHIDWNFEKLGKLWTYNLNYFDFLHQQELEKEQGLLLIDDHLSGLTQLRDGIEPYPISLRGINWIKFFARHGIQSTKYDCVLRSHYEHLAHNLEYHLMGNHLLENGFSLLFGAYYFSDETLYGIASRVLKSELEEQILNDGGHFELSPMYHQILLFRLLDCINLMLHNEWRNDGLKEFMIDKAEKMLGWLRQVTFSNGDIPMVNDSAHHIAPASPALFAYAERLAIVPRSVSLSDSGYRMIKSSLYELFLDVGAIGPDYIPGHAHSDTFNTIFCANNLPILVDVGISTYEKGSTRALERATRSHNTVCVAGRDQSQVWASFRVGRRARVRSLVEQPSCIIAQHDGYENIRATHQRMWRWTEETVEITDEIIGNNSGLPSIASFHFHPDVNLLKFGDEEIDLGQVKLKFEGEAKLSLLDCEISMGFNQTMPGRKLEVKFTDSLKTTILVKDDNAKKYGKQNH